VVLGITVSPFLGSHAENAPYADTYARGWVSSGLRGGGFSYPFAIRPEGDPLAKGTFPRFALFRCHLWVGGGLKLLDKPTGRSYNAIGRLVSADM
jgi:hypothetical protein